MENVLDPEQPAQLPEALVLHILSLLPAVQQAYTARRVCKAAHARLRHAITISASSADLPLAALQEMFLQHATGMYKHWHLAAARAACGDLQGLQWLLSSGCAWDVRVCSNAAQSGHLALLQWARQQDPPCPWNKSTCSAAAAGGQLAVLQWVRQQSLPCHWDEECCSSAAKAGHLKVLQWAR
jgi:hypothetical protein